MNKLNNYSAAVNQSTVQLHKPQLTELYYSGNRNSKLKSKYKYFHFSFLLRVTDCCAILFAGLSSYNICFGVPAPDLASIDISIYIYGIIFIIALHAAQCYKIQYVQLLRLQIEKLFTAVFLSLVGILIFVSGFEPKGHYSVIWITVSFTIGLTLLMLNRWGIFLLLQTTIQSKKLIESVVIVGATEQAEKLVKSIHSSPLCGIDIVGIFDDRDTRSAELFQDTPKKGTMDTMLAFIRHNHVDRMIIALPWTASPRIDGLLRKFRSVPVRIDLLPNNIIWRFPTIGMERLANIPIVTVANSRIEAQAGWVKRSEDIIFSLILIVFTSPLMLFIALALKIENKAPVLFKQTRHGFNNTTFEVYKFGSMTVAASRSGDVTQATRGDKRVTSVGKFLRRSSLDELPQLFNVLKGNMSIVGPRPHAVQHNLRYGAIISEYFGRHNVKPGITGWAQVNGLRGEVDNPNKMRRRLDFDLNYIENWSLSLDLKIIFRTLIVVWGQETAY